ncbi:MAG: RNA polymerase-binding protein DksA [Nitrospirae bacterium]|nr:RNA polymerase-binding protein DksA [Nitrospirota bacterium]
MAQKAQQKTQKKSNAKPVTGKYDEIRQDLEKQKTDILAEAGATIGSGMKPENENFPDLTDQASAETDKAFLIRLREREQKLLVKIDEALDRIQKATFGICESCGEEIKYERLKARPVTTLCIDCKTKQEAEEKLRE